MSARALALLALLSVACGSPPEETAEVETTTGDEEPPPPPPPPPPAHVRVIHAAFDPLAAAVAVAFDGEAPSITELAYQRSSEYVEVSAGMHSLSLIGADGSEILAWTAPEMAEESFTTIVLSSAEIMPVAFSVSADMTEPPAGTAAALRVFHALDGMGAVDVCIAGESARADGILVFGGLEPNTFAGEEGARYAELPTSGETTLQLRATNARTCHGRVQGVARFTPIAGSRYTVVAVGRDARPRIDRELLICADPPATDVSCAAVPITNR
jgi:hypothetical protein